MSKEERRRRRNQLRRSRGTNAHPAPSAIAASGMKSEAMMRDIHRIMNAHDFESIEEANAFLNTLVGPGLKQALQQVPALSPKEEAQDLAYRAMEAPTRAQALALAKQALARDPDCVDALVTIATTDSRSVEELIASLEKAVAAGERSLGSEFFAEEKGHFWGIIETRPYMRARSELAGLLLRKGRTGDAVHHFEALIDLNPNDNQGVRDTLLGCYLSTGNLGGADRLLKAYDKDASAVFAWGRTLERVLSGDLKGAQRTLAGARKQNRFVELYLTGRKELPRSMPDAYSLGSEEEAMICVDAVGLAWATHHAAMTWLMSQTVEIAHSQHLLPNKWKTGVQKLRF